MLFIMMRLYLTMYKYTNLLSESYRPTTNNHPQPNTNTYIPPRASSHCSCNHINQSAHTLDIKSHKMNLDSTGNQYLANLYLKAKKRSTSSVYDQHSVNAQQMSVSDRIQRLSDLSDRHQQALREVQLQSKLKEITNKYARQQRPHPTQYFQSKHPPINTSTKNTSTINKGGGYAKCSHPQNGSRLQINYNRKQKQTNMDQLNSDGKHGSQLQNRIKRIINQSSEVKGQARTDRVEAVSKLANLQQRIRQSIDKLH